MKAPNPDHPILIEPETRRVRVIVAGAVIADTRGALVMREAEYKPVYYIPREDADPAVLTRTARTTRCPYKGDASYFSIAAGGTVAENAAWSYETPFPAMEAIACYLAFYPDRVDAIEVGKG